MNAGIPIALLALVVAGCEARVSLGGGCSSEAECAVELVCVGGRCREECRAARECPVGLRCVAGATGVRVCSLPAEEVCAATDPCDETLFAECRLGRCVTGCDGPEDCVEGGCDTSGTVGICVEPVSVGDADAGAPDAAMVDSGPPCPTPTAGSTRSLAMAVLGTEGSIDVGPAAWLEALGAPAIPIDDPASASLAVGVRVEGGTSPEVLVAVRRARGELMLRWAEPLVDNLHLTIRDDGALASEDGFGALAMRSSPSAVSFVGLRFQPSDELDPFAWVYRQDDSPRPLAPRRTPVGTFPGDAALFLGPGDEELFAVRFAPGADPGGRLGIVASALGPGNNTDFALPPEWGEGPIAIAAAPSTLLLHEATSGQTRIVRVVRVETAPVLDDGPLALETDGPPAIASSTADQYRVFAPRLACGLIASQRLLCDPSGREDCALEPADGWLAASAPGRMGASALGRAVALLVEAEGRAILFVLDEDGAPVALPEPVELPGTLVAGSDTLALTRTSIAAAATGTDALVVIAGVYTRGDIARVRVRSLGVTSP